MADLNVMCDDCLKHLGIVSSRMQKTQPLAIIGPQMEAPLGDTYLCHCGRFYNVRLGYFNFMKGKGMIRQRPVPRCNSLGLEPMYVKAVVRTDDGISRDRAMFACPECGAEQEGDLYRIP